jgi:hypothetical protein
MIKPIIKTKIRSQQSISIGFFCVIKGSTEQVPELALRPSFLSTFGTAVEQANKIGFQQSKSVICMYQNYQVKSLNI